MRGEKSRQIKATKILLAAEYDSAYLFESRRCLILSTVPAIVESWGRNRALDCNSQMSIEEVSHPISALNHHHRGEI